MASWSLAERVIDASSSRCRENLQHALEQPREALSPDCQADVGRLLQNLAQPRTGERRPRKEATQSGVRDDSRGSKHDDKSNADDTAVTIVLTFVSCVLVAVVAFAYCVGGGRTIGGRPMRGARRLPKKKQERIRERGKKRR